MQKKLESVLADQTPAATDQNGAVFDRDQYLKEEGFDDVEVCFETITDVSSEQTYKRFFQGCRGWSKLGKARPEAGARREVVPALRPAMGEGLSAAPARLDRRGLLRAHGVRVQHEPPTSEVGPVSLSGESELRVTRC